MFNQLNFKKTPLTLILLAVMVGMELANTLGDLSGSNRRNEIVRNIGISPYVWGYHDVVQSQNQENAVVYHVGQYWRPMMTCMIHGNLIHAFFNLYWFVIFGNMLERRYGPWRFLGLILFLAYFSIMLQFIVSNFNLFQYYKVPFLAFFERFFPHHQRYIPCVGFSGVIYGLFGFIWYARIKVYEFGWVCSKGTVQTFLIWFVVCLFLTRSGMMPIANTAHGAGLVLGYIIARSLYSPIRHERWNWLLAMVFALLLTVTMLAFTPPLLQLQ